MKVHEGLCEDSMKLVQNPINGEKSHILIHVHCIYHVYVSYYNELYEDITVHILYCILSVVTCSLYWYMYMYITASVVGHCPISEMNVR